MEDVKQQWEAKKYYFEQYKKDGARPPCIDLDTAIQVFFLLYAAWVRSLAERPSVSYTKVVMEVAWTGHNLQWIRQFKALTLITLQHIRQ